MNVVFMLLVPVFYMFASAFSLLWFGFAYEQLVIGLGVIKKYPRLAEFTPVMSTLQSKFQNIFGAPGSFQPNTTQVILVAILMVIFVESERIRRSLAGRNRV
ncbi:hypothetical protein BSKO_07672 [Bryopsis sp. KO-2023]|nr:hypothetical protein BSKO_07672 [Bryopsis sp. KO-2023]